MTDRTSDRIDTLGRQRTKACAWTNRLAASPGCRGSQATRLDSFVSRFISLTVGNAQPELRTFASRHPLLAKRCLTPREELKTLRNSKTSDGAAATLIPNPHAGALTRCRRGYPPSAASLRESTRVNLFSSGRSKSSTPEIEVIYMIRKGQVKDDGVTQTAAAKFNSLVA